MANNQLGVTPFSQPLGGPAVGTAAAAADGTTQEALGLARAASLLGVSDLAYVSSDLYAPGPLTFANALGGAAPAVVSAPGGVYRFTCAITLDSYSMYSVPASVIPTIGASKFYMRARGRLNIAPDAFSTVAIVGAIYSGQNVAVALGVFGSSVTGGSATKFSLVKSTNVAGGWSGGVPSSVDITTASDVLLELWADDLGTAYAAVNSESPISLSLSSGVTATSGQLGGIAKQFQDETALATSFDLDFVMMAQPRR